MHNIPSRQEIRIGIDIGGTFTDFVIFDPETGSLECFKLLSTPHNPAHAVLDGLQRVMSRPESVSKLAYSVVHGSTVATNALLERKGAKTALLTTAGFRDVLQIGRQNRPALYDLQADPPQPLVPGVLRFGIHERVDATGQVLTPLDPSTLDEISEELRNSDVQSVAVCFLFSFANPSHELACTLHLRQAGFFVSASCEVLPEYREFERTSTTVVNAYVTPVLSGYLAQLKEYFQPGLQPPFPVKPTVHLRVMQSNGGIISVEEAQQNGVRCVLSGPAGGVVGAQAAARQAFYPLIQQSPEHEFVPPRLITFDMGGTSTDVSLIDGIPQTTSEMVIGGCPIHLPLLDIHTIGAGGGSIASVDAGGALRVGPESAGADPGPACYGRSQDPYPHPTVTDANLLLGRLSPEHFLGGQMPLYPQRSLLTISTLADKLGISPYKAALGIIEVVNAHMERALRLISVERGYDPRQFTLLSFGGAGGLHATDLASRLGISQILIPRHASTLSAFGMLAADVVKDYSQTVMLSGDVYGEHLRSLYRPLVERAYQEMQVEGFLPAEVELTWRLDVRYQGQSYELSVPLSEKYKEDFHQLHQKTYGYLRLTTPIEVVNLRLQARGKVEPPVLTPFSSLEGGEGFSPIDVRELYFHQGFKRVPFYLSESLPAGSGIEGPAIVFCLNTTVFVDDGWFLKVGEYGDYLLEYGYAKYQYAK